ncbi:hypothetical protein [Prauserella alba]|uniref:Peptide chain release factor 1 (ERF1) n=1 Tax=Prauserella alba TaxID=176898 RepID=A0ABP4FY95_9PSEU|nr:hypothetical protein [Prauserella alba]MCP2182378.1 hypothetical protein [Prauserella alba]
MRLAALRHVYEQPGPCATVYLEGRSPGEDAKEQTRLRWRELRERLQSQGAAESALEALDDALAPAISGEEQANGRVLVANAETVALQAPWDASLGGGDDAVWQELPHLGPYVREHARSIRELVVLASQTGATVRQLVIAEQHEPREVGSQDVEGSAYEQVHKPRGQAESHSRIQNRADEAVSQNAKDVVERLRKISSNFQPHVLVLAGETQGRQAIRAELHDELATILSETDRGGEGHNESDMALTDELLRIAEEAGERRAHQRSEQWQKALAHDLAVQGAQSVARAAELGAVETLLLEPGAEATREAFLLKTCSQTDAGVDLVASGSELDEGVGAILRYPVNF